jgi:hypothetical protein
MQTLRWRVRLLPDFPKSRKQLSEMLMLRLHLRTQDQSPWGSARQITQHEASAFSYEQITDAGKATVQEGFEEVKVPITVRFDEVPTLVGSILLQRATWSPR